jgi:hypothetical protein
MEHEKKPAPPPIQNTERDDVHVGTNRCPFCHDDIQVEGQDWVSCRSCQARHHQACWKESGACGSCGEARFLADAVLDREAAAVDTNQPRRRVAVAVALTLASVFIVLVLGLFMSTGVAPPRAVPAPRVSELAVDSGARERALAERLAKVIADVDGPGRQQAIDRLHDLSPEAARVAIPALSQAFLSGGRTYTGSKAFVVLHRIDPQAAIATMTRALNDPSWGRRSAALDSVKVLGSDAEVLIPRIEALLIEGPSALRSSAGNAFAAIGQPALRPLINLLEYDNNEVRQRAATALGEMGPAAAPAIPALIRLLESQDTSLASTARFALPRIGPEAIPALEAAQKHASPDVRERATSALKDLKRAEER